MEKIAINPSRDKLVDCLKYYACLLVVFGDVIMGVRKSGRKKLPFFSEPLETFIWTFHVVLFILFVLCNEERANYITDVLSSLRGTTF